MVPAIFSLQSRSDQLRNFSTGSSWWTRSAPPPGPLQCHMPNKRKKRSDARKKSSDARRRARRRVAMGLERRGAGLLRGASGTGPAARAGEAGAGTYLRVARARRSGRSLDPRRRRQLGAGKELVFKFNVGRGGSGSGLGPAVVATRQTTGCLPPPGGLRPWDRVGPDGPGPGLDYTQCALIKLRDWRTPAARRRVAPRAFTVFFFSLSHLVVRVARPPGGGGWERDTGRWPESDSGSGQLSRSPYPSVISEFLGLGLARGGGSWERGTGRRPGSGSDQLRPIRKRGARTRSRGNDD